jgi:hypothetical protein
MARNATLHGGFLGVMEEITKKSLLGDMEIPAFAVSMYV